MTPLMAYCDDMNGLVNLHQRDLHMVPRHIVDEFRLALVAKRFADLADRVTALKKMANIQGVSAITALDDIVPILFQHTVYKSYPPSLIEKGKFQALTKWLDQLTAHDLGQVDCSGIEGMDDWFRLLASATPITAIHTTGTSGRLSIIPRTRRDSQLAVRSSCAKWEGVGLERDCPVDAAARAAGPIPIIHPSYRHGFYAGFRQLDVNAATISDEAHIFSLYDEELSADVISLGARVAAAEARGALDTLDIPPSLLARFAHSRQRAHQKGADEDAFFDLVVEKLAGRRVMMAALAPLIHGWARIGLERGYHGLFAPDSWISSGGGTKGLVMPDDWRDGVSQLVGSPVVLAYGMSELIGVMPECSRGNYHVPPYTLPFVLDPETGEALPRHGVQKGRAAFHDLMIDSYWAGFITGDEVVIHWDGDCGCGRKSEYFEPTIRRYSELNGGDDKISCAGAPDAQEKAMSFLSRMADAA